MSHTNDTFTCVKKVTPQTLPESYCGSNSNKEVLACSLASESGPQDYYVAVKNKPWISPLAISLMVTMACSILTILSDSFSSRFFMLAARRTSPKCTSHVPRVRQSHVIEARCLGSRLHFEEILQLNGD